MDGWMLVVGANDVLLQYRAFSRAGGIGSPFSVPFPYPPYTLTAPLQVFFS